ncbi:MAG: hypothetical protein RLZ12_67 [Bacillota bacterium]
MWIGCVALAVILIIGICSSCSCLWQQILLGVAAALLVEQIFSLITNYLATVKKIIIFNACGLIAATLLLIGGCWWFLGNLSFNFGERAIFSGIKWLCLVFSLRVGYDLVVNLEKLK